MRALDVLLPRSDVRRNSTVDDQLVTLCNDRAGLEDRRLPGPRDPVGLRGYVYNVATDPAYRRRGFSRACMTAVLEWFAERAVHLVDLRAADGEPLYASLGFVRTPDPAMRLIAGR